MEKKNPKMTVEIRSDGSVRLAGYINVCERDSRPIPDPRGPFIESVAQGAFTRALERAGDGIELTLNHGRKIGQRGTNLQLREDNIGLYGDAIVSDEETERAARNGELTGWSFRFYKLADQWETVDGIEHRKLLDFDIDEVSILTVTPAYIATSIEMREGEQKLAETRYQETAKDDKPAAAKEPGIDRENIMDVYRAEIEYFSNL